MSNADIAFVTHVTQQISPVPPQYMIPSQRNKRFVGRESKLRELENRLFIHKECQQLAVFGLGGVGKTQLALEFCYTIKSRYPDYSILWVSLISKARFSQDYTKLAKLYFLPIDDSDNIISVVQDHLTSEIAGKWLMIVDNVDDKKLIFDDEGYGSILDKLPRSETSIILFTTRFKDIAFDVADGSIINLDEMDAKEAKTFLSKSLRNDELVQDESLVSELLDELSYLPLAIAQASSYIIKTSITISKYLSLMRNTEKDTVELLSRDFRDHTRAKESQNAVAITWLVSFEQIRNDEPLAADILFFLSCIENKAIPISIIPDGPSNVERTHALGVLVGYSFLVEQSNEMYDMHRLVHLAAKLWIQKEGLVQVWRNKTISHLFDVFVNAGHNYNNRALRRHYITHTIRVLHNTTTMVTEERARLCFQLNWHLQADGRSSEALTWMYDCASGYESMPDDDPYKLRSQRGLAKLYIDHGRHEEALKILQHVAAMSDRVFAENDSDRILGQTALSDLYAETGQAHKAIEIMERIVKIDSRELAEDDRVRLVSKYSLARAYRANNQRKEAMELLQEIVSVATRCFDEDDAHGLA